MGMMLKQFIDRFQALEKVANETLAAEPEALVGVDSLPGSEHDAKVPDEAKKPDEEVAQGQPAGVASTDGAVSGGDAKPLNEGKLEMDEALLNPEKKPLITDDALTAKVAGDANAKLASLVNDFLDDLKVVNQKEASAKDAVVNKKQDNGEKSASTRKNTIMLDDETISKIAAAQAAYVMGRNAASNMAERAKAARLIKAACVKAAQEQGLDPAAAEQAADQAMAVAGLDSAAAQDAGAAAAADAAAQDAGAAAAAEGAGDAAAAGAGEIPNDITEDELAEAIVDLVSSGELDADTAKAIVDEIASDDAAAPSDDQAAEIIAQGIASGEITPEQAQEIAAAIDSGDAAGAGESAASDEAQGAADAAAAIQDANDEAMGAAAAEEAMKTAAAMVRKDAITKIASKIVEKRASAVPPKGAKIMAKVASILNSKKPAPTADDKYAAGFKKKAEEMGVDPAALARYVVENSKK